MRSRLLGTQQSADPDEIGPYVDNLATAPHAESIEAVTIDRPISDALHAAYWLSIKRFTLADEGLEHDIENQRNWNELVMKVRLAGAPTVGSPGPNPPRVRKRRHRPLQAPWLVRTRTGSHQS